MSYKIKGSVQTTGTMIVQGKQPGLNVNLSGNGVTYLPDDSGSINLPIKPKTEMDMVFDELPYSQYGAINNNEPGVAGTFDGGSTVSYYSAMPVLLENDGSLVYLRPGTNGSTINYYYTYMNNPFVSLDQNNTINKYYTGTWNNILFYDTDASNCLIYEEVGNNTLHLVLTNGTLDKDAHQTASIPRNTFSNYIMSASVAGSYLYIVSMYSSTFNTSNPTGMYYNGTDPFQFILHRIPTSEIISGTVTTIEQISGITGNTLYGDAQGSQSYIRISDAWDSSTSTSTKSFIKWQPVFESVFGYTYSINGMVKCIFDGTNLILSISSNAFQKNDNNRFDTMYAFRIFYNVSTNTFTTDLITNSPIIGNGTATSPITYTNPYNVTSNNLFGVGNSNSDALHGSSYITNNGVQFFIKEKYVLSDFYTAYSGTIDNFTSKVDAFNIRNRTFSNVVSKNITSDYASRVGDQLMGGIPISTTKVMFNGTGTYEGINYTKYRKGVAEIGTTRTYSYNSFTNGTISGYAPQLFRRALPDTTAVATYGGVSYCDVSGNVTFYGTQFVENNMLVAGYLLDPTTLTYDKTISIDNNILVSLKNSIIASTGISATSSLISLYYSPNTSYFQSIACVTTVNSSGGGNLIIASVNCTASSTSITSATLITVINSFNNPDIVQISTNGTLDSEMRRHGGLSIVNYSDFTYVSLPHAINPIIPGDSLEYSYSGVKSGNTLTSLKISNSYHAPDLYPTARDYSYIPNYGFGFYMFEKTDKGTKLLFDYRGNTLLEFQNNMPQGNITPVIGTSTPTVVLAQDVIQGFYLYFTEVTPVLMNGKYYEMPITTIDLSTVQANPGNSTFYVYVDSSTGTPEYKVSVTEIAESLTNMYIGYIQTDGTKVSDLNINKVSRIGIYRPSETQIGSAFPVSTGLPTQTGTISW